MVNVYFKGKQLCVQKREFAFAHRILGIRLHKDLVLVHLALPKSLQNACNIYAIDTQKMRVIWKTQGKL